MNINFYTAHLLRRTFVRQISENDCGLACLAMLLRYTGDDEKARAILSESCQENLSLLDLKKLLASAGVASQCVRADLASLDQLTDPLILHTEDKNGNMHYQVYYGSIGKNKNRKYLMADPATHLYFINVKELDVIWKSRTALYPAKLARQFSAMRNPLTSLVFSAFKLPVSIWLIMPLLTLINAVFGVSLSFLLQRGFFSENLFRTGRIIFEFVLLLFIISIFRSAFTFLKQYILLKLNGKMRNYFFHVLAEKLTLLETSDRPMNLQWVRKSYQEISLMQNAVSIFLATLISEGSLLIMLLAAVFYVLPSGGMIMVSLLIFQIIIALKTSFGFRHKSAAIRLQSAEVERTLTFSNLPARPALPLETAYIKDAKRQAVKLSIVGTLLEISGAVAVLVLLGLSLYHFYQLKITYSTVVLTVLLCYLATSMTPRLYAAYLSVVEGADLYNQFRLRTWI